MLTKFRRRLERAVPPGLDIRDALARRFAKRLQTHLRLRFLVLNEAKPLAQYFTCVLISTGGHKTLHKFRLILGQYDVSGRHFRYTRATFRLA